MNVHSRRALLGVGSNLGDRANTLRAAIASLGASPGIADVTTSDFFETAPVGLTDQPPFLNAVVSLHTSQSPEALLELTRTVEQRFGRERTVRWGPRTLDIDLLCFEGESRNSPELQLPHPRMTERPFVLVPLGNLMLRERWIADIWPDLARIAASAKTSADVRRVETH